jgi:alcohol dehydrogenase (cytochrome c)
MLYRDAEGRQRVAIGSKNAYVYVLDRKSHRLVFRTAVTTIVNPGRQPTPAGVRACPGALGGVEWNGPAYSPSARAIYVGAVDWCMVYKSGDVPFKPGGQINYGTDIIMPPDEPRSGWITALDDRTGKINWQFHAPAPVVAGITPTAGGLIFAGDLLGNFYVFDAGTGEVLRARKFDSGLAGGMITYAIDGKQYVAITVGNIGRLTFGGGGTPHVVIMTTGLPSDYVVKSLAVVEPEAAAAAADPHRGKRLFGQFCVACHGTHGEGVPGAGATVQNEAERKSHMQVIAWIKDPAPPMPKLYPAPLSASDVEAVASYLETLKKE